MVNLDDPYGARLAAELRAGRPSPPGHLLAGRAQEADFRAVDVGFDVSGSRFRCLAPTGRSRCGCRCRATSTSRTRSPRSRPVTSLGVPIEAAAAALASAGRVPGRFEPVEEGQPFAVLVDYAHTPDSLQNVLEAARRLTEGG